MCVCLRLYIYIYKYIWEESVRMSGCLMAELLCEWKSGHNPPGETPLYWTIIFHPYGELCLIFSGKFTYYSVKSTYIIARMCVSLHLCINIYIYFLCIQSFFSLSCLSVFFVVGFSMVVFSNIL